MFHTSSSSPSQKNRTTIEHGPEKYTHLHQFRKTSPISCREKRPKTFADRRKHVNSSMLTAKYSSVSLGCEEMHMRDLILYIHWNAVFRPLFNRFARGANRHLKLCDIICCVCFCMHQHHRHKDTVQVPTNVEHHHKKNVLKTIRRYHDTIRDYKNDATQLQSTLASAFRHGQHSYSVRYRHGVFGFNKTMTESRGKRNLGRSFVRV